MKSLRTRRGEECQMRQIKAIWHSIEPAQVLKELNTDLHGLTEDEVKSRLEKYGYNELKKEEGISPFTLFINQFKNILIIILLIASVLSALVGEIVDAVIIAGHRRLLCGSRIYSGVSCRARTWRH